MGTGGVIPPPPPLDQSGNTDYCFSRQRTVSTEKSRHRDSFFCVLKNFVPPHPVGAGRWSVEYRPPEGIGADIVQELAAHNGLTVVEFSTQVVNRRRHVHCILHHPDGVGLDQLSEVHRALQPRLEALFDDPNVRVEFSSPGINRSFKSFHEFVVFRGLRVQILPMGETEWISGILVDADEKTCSIQAENGETRQWRREEVSRARLVE